MGKKKSNTDKAEKAVKAEKAEKDKTNFKKPFIEIISQRLKTTKFGLPGIPLDDLRNLKLHKLAITNPGLLRETIDADIIYVHEYLTTSAINAALTAADSELLKCLLDLRGDNRDILQNLLFEAITMANNYHISNCYKKTAPREATSKIMSRPYKCIKMLIEKIHNENAALPVTNSPLRLIIMSVPTTYQDTVQQIIATMLLQHGGDPNEEMKLSPSKLREEFFLVQESETYIVEEKLTRLTNAIRSINDNKLPKSITLTPLQRATLVGSPGLVKLLLEYGANPLCQLAGLDLLQLARLMGNQEIIDMIAIAEENFTETPKPVQPDDFKTVSRPPFRSFVETPEPDQPSEYKDGIKTVIVPSNSYEALIIRFPDPLDEWMSPRPEEIRQRLQDLDLIEKEGPCLLPDPDKLDRLYDINESFWKEAYLFKLHDDRENKCAKLFYNMMMENDDPGFRAAVQHCYRWMYKRSHTTQLEEKLQHEDHGPVITAFTRMSEHLMHTGNEYPEIAKAAFGFYVTHSAETSDNEIFNINETINYCNMLLQNEKEKQNTITLHQIFSDRCLEIQKFMGKLERAVNEKRIPALSENDIADLNRFLKSINENIRLQLDSDNPGMLKFEETDNDALQQLLCEIKQKDADDFSVNNKKYADLYNNSRIAIKIIIKITGNNDWETSFSQQEDGKIEIHFKTESDKFQLSQDEMVKFNTAFEENGLNGTLSGNNDEIDFDWEEPYKKIVPKPKYVSSMFSSPATSSIESKKTSDESQQQVKIKIKTHSSLYLYPLPSESKNSQTATEEEEKEEKEEEDEVEFHFRLDDGRIAKFRFPAWSDDEREAEEKEEGIVLVDLFPMKRSKYGNVKQTYAAISPDVLCKLDNDMQLQLRLKNSMEFGTICDLQRSQKTIKPSELIKHGGNYEKSSCLKTKFWGDIHDARIPLDLINDFVKKSGNCSVLLCRGLPKDKNKNSTIDYYGEVIKQKAPSPPPSPKKTRRKTHK